ncbi:putative metalloprotease CJM1_0395 family protein [Chromobacterium vaccinii]|uniref:putative metalloprotease CJM1_0395 family protein n=1 Tax=Chromobacterium vaccinii TaxID=1108595 RepID=UPI0006963183|nr:putative metalloprotease CJM1_0395 family protein [Chromobacterium vaccinii]
MSISSVAGGSSSYGFSMHGANCQCPACQALRSQAAPVSSASASSSPQTANAAPSASAGDKAGNDASSQNDSGNAHTSQQTNAASPKGPDGKPLNDAQQKEVEDLRSRDVDVRRHEAAHQAAGGALAGAASFTYQQGPDGKQYAIGGEVPIRLSQGSTPQETIQNAQTVRAAALAPSDPSGQDRAVAAEASQMEQQARAQQFQQQHGNQNLSPLQKMQQAAAPSGSAQAKGGNIDTYA